MIIIIISISRNMKLATVLLYRLRINIIELIDAMLNATGLAGHQGGGEAGSQSVRRARRLGGRETEMLGSRGAVWQGGAGEQPGKQAGEWEGIQAGMQRFKEDRRPGSRRQERRDNS